ncbi:hypothetical protein BAUCODRAFT_42515, partial [Baudoinia panamericana UAMH 10762]
RRRPPRPGALADLSPTRILTQIALLQILYYAVASILIAFVLLVAGTTPTLSHLLDWHHIRGDVTTGWTLALCWILDSLITVIPILLFIARSKLVPDFALTIHFLHLVVVSLYARSVPSTVYWWLVQACSAALMVSVGVWACQWRELQPMAFGGKGKGKGKQRVVENGHAQGGATGAGEEAGEGFAVGGGRGGSGRDGGGTYEMVGM